MAIEETIPLAAQPTSSSQTLGELDIEKMKDPEKTGTAAVPEVAAVVSEVDDPSLPCMSFRAIFMGVFFSVLLGAINQYFWFKSNPITLNQIPCALLSFFMGKAMEKTLPDWKFNWPWIGEWSLNPGPFNTKEHALVVVFANAGFQASYATDVLGIQRLFYKQNFGPVYGILMCLTTQIMGYGIAGLGRAILVDPPSMWWPGNLPTVALFNTLHEKSDDHSIGVHAKFFGIAAAAAFVWFFFPGYLMPILTSLSILCWFNQSSPLVGNIGSGLSGLGVLNFSLDWATITAYLLSPLAYPTYALVNILVGTIILAWIMVPAMYYQNVWNAQLFPISSSGGWAVVNGTAQRFSVLKVLTPEKTLDEAKYAAYSDFNLSIFFAMAYATGFAGLTAMFTHVILFHGKEIVQRYRASRIEDGDVHNRLMEAYPNVPYWWYGALFAICTAGAFVVVCAWPTEMPWWALLLAIFLAVVTTVPSGIVMATTNILPGTNVITEEIIGLILPGRPICNVLFKTYGYISQYQAVTFLQDLKLGHYMKIPPKKLFWAQFWGTVISALVNYVVMDAIFTNIVHDDDQAVLNGELGDYTLPNARVFFTASIVWGVIGPARLFGPSSNYFPLNWAFLIGAILPIPFWYLHTRNPTFGWDNVNFPAMFNGLGFLPPAGTVNYFTFCAVGIFFNHYIRKRFTKWWNNFNYVLSAALDSGTIVASLVVALAIVLPTGTAFSTYYFGNPDTGTSGLTVEYCALP